VINGWPNHTLPTSGTAAFASAPERGDFPCATRSLISFNSRALEATGPAGHRLARSEGLHSMRIGAGLRLSASPDPRTTGRPSLISPPAPGPVMFTNRPFSQQLPAVVDLSSRLRDPGIFPRPA